MKIISRIMITGKDNRAKKIIKEIEELWNSRHKKKIELGIIVFDVNRESEYYELKELFREKRQGELLEWHESRESAFTRKEYLKMDRLLIWCRYTIERNAGDLNRSYRFAKCPSCNTLLDMEQVAPLCFSVNLFERDEDILDPYINRKANMFSTTFGEWIVSERTRNILLDNGFAGGHFEKVTFEGEKPPAFFQVVTEKYLGNLIYPPPQTSGKRCPQCGSCNDSLPESDIIFIVPLESDPNLLKDWRIWALKFLPGDDSENDVLLTKERYGPKGNKKHYQVINGRIFEMMMKNNIKDFRVSPVEIIR